MRGERASIGPHLLPVFGSLFNVWIVILEEFFCGGCRRFIVWVANERDFVGVQDDTVPTGAHFKRVISLPLDVDGPELFSELLSGEIVAFVVSYEVGDVSAAGLIEFLHDGGQGGEGRFFSLPRIEAVDDVAHLENTVDALGVEGLNGAYPGS